MRRPEPLQKWPDEVLKKTDTAARRTNQPTSQVSSLTESRHDSHRDDSKSSSSFEDFGDLFEVVDAVVCCEVPSVKVEASYQLGCHVHGTSDWTWRELDWGEPKELDTLRLWCQ